MQCGFSFHQRFRRQTGTPLNFIARLFNDHRSPSLYTCSTVIAICTPSGFALAHLQTRYLMDKYTPKLDFGSWTYLNLIGRIEIDFFCFLDAHRPCVHAADFFQFKNKITHWMNLNTYLYIYPPLNARRAERRRAVPCWEDGDAEQFRIRNQRPGQRVRSWTLFIIYILHLPLSHILT